MCWGGGGWPRSQEGRYSHTLPPVSLSNPRACANQAPGCLFVFIRPTGDYPSPCTALSCPNVHSAEDNFSSGYDGVVVERSGGGPRACPPPPSNHLVTIPPGGWGGCCALWGGGMVSVTRLLLCRCCAPHTLLSAWPTCVICCATAYCLPQVHSNAPFASPAVAAPARVCAVLCGLRRGPWRCHLDCLTRAAALLSCHCRRTSPAAVRAQTRPVPDISPWVCGRVGGHGEVCGLCCTSSALPVLHPVCLCVFLCVCVGGLEHLWGGVTDLRNERLM